MPSPNYLADGFETIGGVSGAHPVAVPRNMAAYAVNRFFRYDTNAPRPGIRHIELTFLDDTTGNNKKLFEAGNVQGVFWYVGYPTSQSSFIIVSVAGTIFTVEIIGRQGFVRKLFEGNDPVFTHAWFGQAFEWLVIQDGTAAPILWDGTNAARRAVAGEVPVGSVMAFIHGRLAVASSDGTNQIAVGDIVYGSDQTTTADVINFTETGYWAEGGAFGAPVYVGDITGLYAMPYLDTGTGQNELVVLGTQGAVSIDLSKPRTEWMNSSILRISLIGGGCVSPHSLASMNGDLLFRSAEGVRSYRNARMEYQKSWKQTPISSDVRRWIGTDSPALLQYNSQVSWNNLLLSTCAPRIAPANNEFAGHHRFHLGFVVLDAWPESNTLGEGAAVWHGMWTGIRPIGFATGLVRNTPRCFALSHDCDGFNRLYEITEQDPTDTFAGDFVRIRSAIETGNLGVVERVTNNFELKRIGGGTIELSRIREPVDVTVRFNSDQTPCYVELDHISVGCACKEGTCDPPKPGFTLPTNGVFHLSASAETCAPGSSKDPSYVFHWQARIEMEGAANIERFKMKFEDKRDSENKECEPPDCEPFQCCIDDYYCIGDTGVGPPVPELPTPSDINQFTASASYTAACPTGTSGTPVTVTTSATSYISFEDALEKAKMAAQSQAISQLVCDDCTPLVVFAFISNNETTDLSAFFASGAFPSSYFNRPWRLIETVTEIEYANGYVDENGTLVIVWTLPAYGTYLDPITFQFVDDALTDGYFSLEVGCSPNTFPGTPSYFSP